MKINHEHEAIKDKAEEMYYEGTDWDQIFDYFVNTYESDTLTQDDVSDLIIQVEHRVNDVPNDGFYIEEPNPYEN
ncbi:hypothetical protein [Bacillus mycoides]|uniref:hypothetical protein n=1 Tax=Bacillus mycoides TaxID=1405 RepID=UPI00027C1780|nr:hypothetical protein [Bacillus mycoides]EJV59313.1 hypothetical protein IEU_05578 [Bacillus mycoides]